MSRKPTKPRPLWLSLLVNMLTALIVVALVQAFLVKAYRVPSASMEQTLQSVDGGGDRMLVNRTAYPGGGPSRGDVVVFTRPDSWATETPTGTSGGLGALVRTFGDLTGIGPSNEQYLVKRIVAVGGDSVSCCDSQGRLVINGEPVDEPYIFEDFPYVPGQLDCSSEVRSARCFPDFTVPEGQLLALGDHRSQSSDSVFLCRSSGAPMPAEECVRTVPVSSVVGRVFIKVWPLNRLGTVS
ncbi:signal peptidase I [Pseudarthrobacter sp. J75]|uniref:signal peptidase I n=1 Tax=unclassified Pseudarthrobacter TaxID=2647000 RepID=UPI002E80AD46|nr:MULTISPECIES: signal peptidase I [unclassified Pseudarthrobacter]MEE2524690.1 signal peptidase I [Pseudarthrobacter sp. J47]MEE2528222.1 signal peptidase I [Pseudarthrobacter sp. J75]